MDLVLIPLASKDPPPACSNRRRKGPNSEFDTLPDPPSIHTDSGRKSKVLSFRTVAEDLVRKSIRKPSVVAHTADLVRSKVDTECKDLVHRSRIDKDRWRKGLLLPVEIPSAPSFPLRFHILPDFHNHFPTTAAAALLLLLHNSPRPSHCSALVRLVLIDPRKKEVANSDP